MLERVAPSAGLSLRLVGIARMHGLGHPSHVLAGVEEVEHPLRPRKVLALKILQPVPRVADRQGLLELVPTDPRRLTTQLETQGRECVKTR